MKCAEFEARIDALIDGELSEEARAEMEAHAESCEDCAEKLRAAKMLQDVLSHMDDSVAVPLQAQAGWRRAVAAEAKRKRFSRIYRIAGAVAAALVVAVCLPMLLRNPTKAPEAHVEVDGVEKTAQLGDEAETAALKAADMEAQGEMLMATSGMPDAERRVSVENIETAYGYAMDIVKEYSGSVESEAQDAGERCAYVLIPADNAEDFISAIDHLGTVADSSYRNETDGDMVEICVRLIQE